MPLFCLDFSKFSGGDPPDPPQQRRAFGARRTQHCRVRQKPHYYCHPYKLSAYTSFQPSYATGNNVDLYLCGSKNVYFLEVCLEACLAWGCEVSQNCQWPPSSWQVFGVGTVPAASPRRNHWHRKWNWAAGCEEPPEHDGDMSREICLHYWDLFLISRD